MPASALSRRQALLAGAALPFAAALAPLGLATPARAAAEMMGAAPVLFNRFRLGTFDVTALMAGTQTAPDPHKLFATNLTPEEFATVSAANFIPADKAQFFFTPTVVNTGTELVLFDTGVAPEPLTAALAAAGYTPDQVDVVVLSHMHPDHIGGLMTAGTPTFPNARYLTGAVEHNHWMGAQNEMFDANVRPLNDRITFVDDGGSIAPGITAMAAFGHSPGHMTYQIESTGQRLVLTADTANHYVWALANPDWPFAYDADAAAAAATRRAVFGMIAADRVPFLGYHMPFPSLGFIETAGDGFRYVPASYQMMMQAG